jgi:crossover junction endodeoxyribonuclease RusA
MLKKIDLFLPFPPSINSFYSKTKNGVFISKVGREYQTCGIGLIREQLPAFEILEAKLRMVVVLYPPDKRIRDLDNYMKPLLDTITKADVWQDDSLVEQLCIYRGEIVKPGSVFVRICEASLIIENNTLSRAVL